MVRIVKCFLTVTLIMAISGCAAKSAKNIKEISEPRLASTVKKCVNCSGLNNINQWEFDAEAIATIYEDEGKTLISQKHCFNYDAGKIALTIDSKGKDLIVEQIKDNNKMFTKGCLCPKNSKACIAARLKLYSIAVSAFQPLLNDDIELSYITKEEKGGMCCHIVEASGNILSCCREGFGMDKLDNPDTVTLWVDDKTGHICKIWMKYLKNIDSNEYGYITANISNFIKYSNGISLPTSIEFIPSDMNTNDSGKTIMKIDVQRFIFENNLISSKI